MTTLRDQYIAVARQTGVTPPELNVHLESCYLYLWNLYVKIQRGSNVDYQGIESFCKLTGIHLTAYEIDIVISIQEIYRSVVNG